MKTKNKVLISLLSASFIIGGGAFLACYQNVEPVISADAAAGPERKAADARFTDGHYVFYFKNGTQIDGDCDGYSSEYGGKTTIYEWWRSDINDWIKRVKSAGATGIKTNSDEYHSGYY